MAKLNGNECIPHLKTFFNLKISTSMTPQMKILLFYVPSYDMALLNACSYWAIVLTLHRLDSEQGDIDTGKKCKVHKGFKY